MKRIVIGMAAAMSLFATGAVAADLAARPYVKAPIVDPVWSWTGFYVGANGGYSWGRSRTDVSYFNTPTGAPIAPPAGSITSAAFDMNGGIAGAQAGYNWQNGNWVYGIEGDLQWSGERGSALYSCAPAAGPVPGVCNPLLTFLLPGTVGGTTLAIDQKLQWFGTLRGRVGILATPKVLFYGTGGLAFGEIKTTGTMTGLDGFSLPITSVASNSTTRAGWTLGVGVEGKITQNWSAKLEYLYMDLGRFSSGPFTLAPASNISANVSSHFTDHILRAGINYQFGGPVVAKY
jgi:outer membrane immunogenic protein